MSEPSIDEKIERLVRSVLEAVDTRLADVRQELHDLATLADRRHDAVEQQLRELERRMERQVAETHNPATGPDPLAARMEQATQVLLERIEAMHQRNTMATNERFAVLSNAIDQLRPGGAQGSEPAPAAAPVGPPADTSAPKPLIAGLDAMNAPLRIPTPTIQQPAIPGLVAHSAAPATDGRAGESIDIDKLADLLSERLGHLSLPPHHQ